MAEGYVRVGPRAEPVRGVYRFCRGRDLQTGKRHSGKWTDRQHAALRFGVIAWLTIWVWWLIAREFGQVPSWLPVWWLHLTLALGFWAAARWVFVRTRNWTAVFFYGEPLADALREIIGWSDLEPASHWVHIPLRLHQRDDATIRIDLKHNSAQDDKTKELIVGIAASSLGLEFEPSDATWRQAGRHPHVVLHRPTKPPTEAWFMDNLERITASRKPGEIVWGVGTNKRLVKDDIAGETPMGAIVAQPGRGKSQTLACAGAQFAHDGAVLAVLDPKAGSLRCFKGIPNAVYAGSIEDADELITRLFAEFERRKALLGDRPYGAPVVSAGPPILILIEEADSLIEGLRILNVARNNTRANVSSIADLLRLRNMGRELEMYQLMVTQSGDARAAGSGGARSAFAFFLVSADRASWRKVTGASEHHKPISRHKGRWHRFRNGELTEVQVFGFHEPADKVNGEKMQEARDFALSGRVAEIPELLKLGSVPPRVNVSEAKEQAERLGTQVGFVSHPGGVVSRVASHPHLRLVEDEEPFDVVEAIGEAMVSERGERLLSYRDAYEEGVVTLSWSGFRNACKRARDAGRPLPVEPRTTAQMPNGPPVQLFALSDLVAWEQSRQAARA